MNHQAFSETGKHMVAITVTKSQNMPYLDTLCLLDSFAGRHHEDRIFQHPTSGSEQAVGQKHRKISHKGEFNGAPYRPQ